MARIRSEVQLYIILIIYTFESQVTFSRDRNRWQRAAGGMGLVREPIHRVGLTASPAARVCTAAPAAWWAAAQHISAR